MALEGNYIVNETQRTKLVFDDTTGQKVGPFTEAGWYQLIATADCFIKIVNEEAADLGVDAASVTATNGCDLFSDNGEKWYIPEGGYLGAIGYPDQSGEIRIHKVGT